MESPRTEPFVLGRADAMRISAEDSPLVLRLATSETTGGAFTLFEVGDADVGSGPPMHIHREADETFYVLSGSYRMDIDGLDHHCGQAEGRGSSPRPSWVVSI